MINSLKVKRKDGEIIEIKLIISDSFSIFGESDKRSLQSKIKLL